MPQCGICLEQIGLIYYKSNCDCKIVYHYPCIIDWYKIKKQCILCKSARVKSIHYLIWQYNKKKNILFCLLIWFLVLFLILLKIIIMITL
jgi:hypothetical protein